MSECVKEMQKKLCPVHNNTRHLTKRSHTQTPAITLNVVVNFVLYKNVPQKKKKKETTNERTNILC